MEWNNDITGELPARREGEPENLRKDIADELSDHLHCALNRELHSTQDEQLAKQNVLSRFGNVNRIARQLWFDWMKETIMTQRLNLAMTSLMTVVCIVLCFFVWNVSENSRKAMQTSQQLSQAIMAKLDAFSSREPETEPRSLEWNSYQVAVVQGKKDGRPAEGFRVALTGDILNSSKSITVSKKTGEDGIADFGLVRPGQHRLDIRAPWGESSNRTITLGPGESRIDEVVSFPDPLVTADVEFSVNLPDDLKDKNLWTVCSFTVPRREVEGTIWRQRKESRHVVISPTGQIAFLADANYRTSPVTEEVIEATRNRIERSKQQMLSSRQARSAFGRRSGTFSGFTRRVTAERIGSEFVPRIHWTGSETTLTNVTVGMRRDVKSTPTSLTLEYAQSTINSSRIPIGGFVQTRSISETDWPVEARTFTIEPGKANHWEIVLPDSLIDGIRLSLQLAEIEKDANTVPEALLPEQESKDN